MGLSGLIFAGCAAFALAAALAVVFTRNTVYCALWFVAHLGALAVMYALLNAPLLGALQVMVYAGAVMVLFIFAIMILDIEHLEDEEIGGKPWILAGSAALVATLGGLFFGLSNHFNLTAAMAPAPAADVPSLDIDNLARLGRVLYRDYTLAFELTGLLLLVAVVGIMVMAKRHLEDRP